jgi:hypothetical protein
MGGVIEGIYLGAWAAEGKIEIDARSDLVNYRTTRSDLGNYGIIGGGGIVIIVITIIIVVVVIAR